jgi:hypothetical protein
MINTTTLRDTAGNPIHLLLKLSPGSIPGELEIKILFPDESSDLARINPLELLSAVRATTSDYIIGPTVWLNSVLFPDASTIVNEQGPDLIINKDRIEIGSKWFDVNLYRLLVAINDQL